MGNFNRGGQSSGGGFNRGFGGGRDGGKPPMFQAVCSECNAACQLPFRPSGDRPVFCSNCFAEKQEGEGSAGGARPSSFGGGDRHERPRFEDRQMFDAVCDKCSKKCQVPFRPAGGKPVYCSDCFDKGGRDKASSGDSGEVLNQLKALNVKIDKLIKILAPNSFEEKVEKIEVVVPKKELAKGVKVEKEVEKLEVKKEKKVKTKAAVKKVTTKKKK